MTVDPGPVSKELDAYIERYQRNRDRWAWGYYAARGSVIVLGAAIPVMTTLATLPKTAVALAGGLIVVIEGVSRLCGFHDRYISARVLYKSLVKERLLFQASAPPYTATRDARERALADRMVRLLDMYDTQIYDLLTKPDTEEPQPRNAEKP
jgi:hypothetical protein